METFNVFNHRSFVLDVDKDLRRSQTKEEFAEKLRRSLMYYFWSKCEWEIIVSPWVGGRGDEGIKIDVYWQVMNNWDIFLDYIWNIKNHEQERKPSFRNHLK